MGKMNFVDLLRRQYCCKPLLIAATSILLLALVTAVLPVPGKGSTTLSHGPRQHLLATTPNNYEYSPTLHNHSADVWDTASTTTITRETTAVAADPLPHHDDIDVLPPSPDDTPVECDANATLHASCGPERYCAPLHHNHHHNATEDDTSSYVCLHKTLWFPQLDARDLLALILTGGCCFLAAMAGIGGGGLILPILLLCCNFTPKEASVLSNTAVFCNTTGQFCINNYNWKQNSNTNNDSSRNRHEEGNIENNYTNNNRQNKQALIYATVLMIMPGLIAGGSIAITLEGMVPSTVILILALFTLLLATTKTYHKAKKMKHAEEEEAQAQEASQQQQRLFDMADEHRFPEMSPLESEAASSPRHFFRDHVHANNNNNNNERGMVHSPQDDALIASALEWGSVLAGDGGSLNDPSPVHNINSNHNTPASKRSRDSTGLLDVNDTKNNDILQEQFFGSIRFLMQRGTNDGIKNGGAERRALINDELATTSPPSSQVNLLREVEEEEDDQGSRNSSGGSSSSCPIEVEEEVSDNGSGNDRYRNNNNNHGADLRHRRPLSSRRRGRNSGGDVLVANASRDASTMSQHTVWHHVGTFGRCCAFCLGHKLQLLIGACWVLDATTFLLLHSEKLVPKCSLPFFILIGAPSLVAIMFVGLARRHLVAAKRHMQLAYSPLFGGDDDDDVTTEDDQPFLMASGSLLEESREHADEDDIGPVPTLPELASGAASSTERPAEVEARQSSPPAMAAGGNWVLFLPIISVIAGLVKALQDRPLQFQRRQRVRGLNVSTQEADNGFHVPFLRHSPVSDSGQSSESLHDDYESLLAWWLPWASVLIGLLSALLGIGGGELLGPILLLLLRMDPTESSATTAIMSMMNSGTNLLHYIVADMMVAPGYAINLGFAGLLGGSGGRLWAISIAQQGRASIIAMSLCGVLSLATALVAWELLTTPLSWESKAGIC